MKKFFILFLAVVMTLSMSVTAFATDGQGSDYTLEDDHTTSIAVNGELNDKSGNDIMVYVDWGNMTFEYIKNDYDNYTGEYSSYWSEARSGDITVKNYSNVAVNCSFGFTSDVWGGNVNFAEGDEWLGTAAYKAVWDAGTSTYSLEAPVADDLTNSTPPCGVISVTIDRDAAAIDSNSEIGTITIYISAAQ